MGVAVSFLSALFPRHVPVIRRSPEWVDVRTGAGGKTPKRPSRTRSSPYDRPPREKRRGWFSKLLVRPSIFSFFTGDGDPRPYETLPVAAAETVGPKIGFQRHADENLTKLVSDDDNGLAEIEHRLKDEIFSRDESIHLIQLLRSRTPDLSNDDIDHARSTLHAVDYPRNLRTIKPFRLIPKRSVLNDDHVQVKSIPYVRQKNMAAAASDSPFDSKGISWPYKRKSEDISSTVHPQISMMAQKILEHIFQPDTPMEESQNLEQAFSRPELPSSATQKDFSWPTLTKSLETESTVLPQTTEKALTALEHIDRSVFDKEKPQELGQASPRVEIPPSATSLMDGDDKNSDMMIPNDCKSGSLVDREMDTQAPEHSQKDFSWPTLTKSQETESTVLPQTTEMAQTALEHIDRSVFNKEKPQELGQAFPRLELPPSATSLMDGHDKNSDMRIPNDCKSVSLIDREMDTQVPEHSQKLFLWPTSSKSQEFESTVDRSLSSKGQLEELEIASSPPESAPNFATFLMYGQDERSDSRTYDGRYVSSNGQLEKLELNFLSKPPPNSATLMTDGRDEWPGTTTYDDRSVSSNGLLRDERPGTTTYDDRFVSSKGQLERKGQLEGKELTFSLPNPPPNSATFLMNDQDEMRDLRTYDDLKTWSFTGNEMDISDREDSEEVLSDISTSESEDMDLHRPSKRARTSDSGFSGTFSMPPAWKIFAEPTLFPAYTFISRENWTLDGWPGRGQI